MLAFEISETFFFDEYNITKFFDRYVDLCLNYDLEEEEKIRRLFRYCDLINEQYVRIVINENVFECRLVAGLGFGHVGQPDPIQS
jgi:hypothetical protein